VGFLLGTGSRSASMNGKGGRMILRSVLSLSETRTFFGLQSGEGESRYYDRTRFTVWPDALHPASDRSPESSSRDRTHSVARDRTRHRICFASRHQATPVDANQTLWSGGPSDAPVGRSARASLLDPGELSGCIGQARPVSGNKP
jgi:hypothetical protein